MGHLSKQTFLFTTLFFLSGARLAAAYDFQKINEALAVAAAGVVAESQGALTALDIQFDAAKTDVEADAYTLNCRVDMKPFAEGTDPIVVLGHHELKLVTDAATQKQTLTFERIATIRTTTLPLLRLKAEKFRKAYCQDLKVTKVSDLVIAEKCAHTDQLISVTKISDLEPIFSQMKAGLLVRLGSFLDESNTLIASSKTDLAAQKLSSLNKTALLLQGLFGSFSTSWSAQGALMASASGGSLELHPGIRIDSFLATFQDHEITNDMKGELDFAAAYLNMKPQIKTILSALEEKNTLAIEMVKLNFQSIGRLMAKQAL